MVTGEITTKAYLISLARQPERRSAAQQRFAVAGITAQNFDAVDGSKLSADQLAAAQAPGTINFTPGMIGACLSHRALWRTCLDLNEPIMVFEDDAVLRHDFKPRLAGAIAQIGEWHIILFGYNFDAGVEVLVTPETGMACRFSKPYQGDDHLHAFANGALPVGLHRLLIAFGTPGYVVTPAGADALLRHCFPLDNRPVRMVGQSKRIACYGIDCLMTTAYAGMLAYACIAPLVASSNDPATTSIEKPDLTTR